MTTSEPPQKFPLGLAIAAVLGFTFLVGLGLWQLQRRAWKEALLTRVHQLATAPIRPLSAALSNPDPDMMRVEIACRNLDTAPFLQLYAVRDGEAGVRLISVCQRADGGTPTVLIDRGYIPDTIKARPPLSGPPRLVTLRAVVRVPEKPSFFAPANPDKAGGAWYRRDIAAMAKALGAPTTAPFYLSAETSSNPDFPALLAAPLPKDIPNRHLEYALTWFGLALALGVIAGARLWPRRRS